MAHTQSSSQFAELIVFALSSATLLWVDFLGIELLSSIVFRSATQFLASLDDVVFASLVVLSEQQEAAAREEAKLARLAANARLEQKLGAAVTRAGDQMGNIVADASHRIEQAYRAMLNER